MMLPPFHFPVLSIRCSVVPGAVPGEEHIDHFKNYWDLTHCRARDLENHALVGMLLFDSAGRCWRIESVQDLGIDATFWGWLFRMIGADSLLHRISCEFVEKGPVPLEALRERVCAAIAGNPDQWRDDEAIAGEDGPPQDEWEMLAALQDKVRQAQSVPQIITVLFDEGAA